jgi:hypothetical protein
VSLRLRWFSISKSEDAAVRDGLPSNGEPSFGLRAHEYFPSRMDTVDLWTLDRPPRTSICDAGACSLNPRERLLADAPLG